MVAPAFLLLGAMPEECAPFLPPGEPLDQPGPAPHSALARIDLDGVPGAILRTGVGPVAAATALSAYLATNKMPKVVLSIGSAGGLHPEVAVGSVVIGSTYRYADVDARAFGYEFGQVPGMPTRFMGADIPVGVLGTAREHTHVGLIVTSSSFVSADLATPIREQFPEALAVDMESAALAQTMHLHGGAGFVSIRGISDLCTPRAGEDSHDGLGLAARRSFEIASTFIRNL